MNRPFLVVLVSGFFAFSASAWASVTGWEANEIVCSIEIDGQVETLRYEFALTGEITMSEDGYVSTCEDLDPSDLAEEIVVEEGDRILLCRDGMVMSLTIFSENGNRFMIGDEEVALTDCTKS